VGRGRTIFFERMHSASQCLDEIKHSMTDVSGTYIPYMDVFSQSMNMMKTKRWAVKKLFNIVKGNTYDLITRGGLR
jgi:hypothetical protein